MEYLIALGCILACFNCFQKGNINKEEIIKREAAKNRLNPIPSNPVVSVASLTKIAAVDIPKTPKKRIKKIFPVLKFT